jgi:hypothetical protein
MDKLPEWKKQANPAMLDLLRDGTPPEFYKERRTDRAWHPLMYLYAEANLGNENLDFLTAVEDYRAAGSASAPEIHEKFVKVGAPRYVNLYDTSREPLDELFEGDDEPQGQSIFDVAYTEVIGVVDLDFYREFKATASNMQKELRAEGEPSGEEEDPREEVTVSARRQST